MTAKLWEDIKKSATEAISYVSEKTEELTTVGRLKVEIAGLKRKIEGKFKDLGNLVYGRVEEGRAGTLGEDETVKNLVTEISTLEKELRAKEEELRRVGRKESQEKQGETETPVPDQGEPVPPAGS